MNLYLYLFTVSVKLFSENQNHNCENVKLCKRERYRYFSGYIIYSVFPTKESLYINTWLSVIFYIFSVDGLRVRIDLDGWLSYSAEYIAKYIQPYICIIFNSFVSGGAFCCQPIERKIPWINKRYLLVIINVLCL
jgi:hypothetical protein